MKSDLQTIYPWILNELDYIGRENIDQLHVQWYDSKEDANSHEELELLKQLGLNSDSIVVDLGAGTGQLTSAVAPFCAKVIAVDLSPVMLDALKFKLADSTLSNIKIVQSGFLTYKHHRQPADFVYSRFALHHIPDFWKVMALKRIRSFIQKNGILRLWDVVFNFSPDETENKLENWCASLDDAKDNGWTRADIEEHIRDEHSTYTWLFEAMLQRSGFNIEQAQYSPDGIFAKYVARAV